jgi:cysteine desulfurase/selenocysteine lyase
MSLKPRPVLEAMRRYYEETPYCAGRAVYEGARAVSDAVDSARASVARWLGADDASRVLFTRNATEAINLVAHARRFKRGDVVLGSDKEHNSNLVPWQIAEQERGIRYEVVPSAPDGTFDIGAWERRLARGDARLVALAHASNLDGTSIPAGRVRDLVSIAHAHGAGVLLDGAQAAAHAFPDVARTGVDYYAASSHKALGPTGVGALYVSDEGEAALGPFLTGGETVVESSYAGHTLAEFPARFEAGLQDYAGIVGAGAAARYLCAIGWDWIHDHEARLNAVASKEIGDLSGLTILGPADSSKRGAILAFAASRVDPDELAILLDDKHRIWVRSGNHCVHAWFASHGVSASLRASFYVYNTEEEARAFGHAVRDLVPRLQGLTRSG